ncbi:hypothetical protein IP78_05205 [Brevundimonas sp. AAP58]|uniref:type II toxin-antitoxin system VapC family toxin n=1 Tax=Brevundimonas sp. AAP58 TaxID=1523422 RepID=UPI0006B8A4BC|nr:PIN domain-containing protein [Brevundimonas sp. AAP58]KPF81334.1 hypothetical protein IP78_05205 [Brevundimonas sp. AAP58]
MIAADTSTVIDWLRHGPIDRDDIKVFMTALRSERIALPPPVVTELLSFPRADARLQTMLDLVGRLPVAEGFWERAGTMRARLRAMGLKCKLPDALIAQCCIDAGTPLITRDGDFRHFAAHCGLELAS